MHKTIVTHVYVCDQCGMLANIPVEDEERAKIVMLHAVDERGWKLEHPGWKLTCLRCQRSPKPFMTDDEAKEIFK